MLRARFLRALYLFSEQLCFVIQFLFGLSPLKKAIIQTQFKYSVKMTIVNGSLSAYT